jgi:hypothetical protein
LNTPLFVRVSDAAELLQVSRAKAFDMARRGIIPTVNLDGCRRVPVEALRELGLAKAEPQPGSIPPSR